MVIQLVYFLGDSPDTGPAVEGQLNRHQVALPPPLPEAPPGQEPGQQARGQQEVQPSGQGVQGQDKTGHEATTTTVVL